MSAIVPKKDEHYSRSSSCAVNLKPAFSLCNFVFVLLFYFYFCVCYVFAFLCKFDIEFWNYSDSVVF